MKTAAQLTNAIAKVDPIAIGRAHKVFEGSTSFYKVSSSRDETVEYSVKHSKEIGFTCTCEAGLRGFANCKVGVCSHVLIALACAREEREAIAELHAAIAVQKAMSDPTTIAQAEQAKEAPEKVARKRETAPYQPKAFSILR